MKIHHQTLPPLKTTAIGDKLTMSIPIIYIHTNNALYLQIALLQAKKVCHNNIHLLGDHTNQVKFINHHLISDYIDTGMIKSLDKVFKNFSPNSYEYELFCFKRWFIILNFCKRNNINNCFCLDSDVLIYQDLNSLDSILQSKGFSVVRLIGNFAGPQCSYFTTDYLEKFCLFVIDMYSHHIDVIKSIYNQLQQEKNISGISDMVLLALFCQQHRNDFIDFDYNDQRDYCFDENIVCSAGFEYTNGFKKIKFKDTIPYGTREDTKKLIRFYMLHFQGAAKIKMEQYSTLSLTDKLKSPFYPKQKAKQILKHIIPKAIKKILTKQ